jgi:hypothetical protein
MTLTLCRPLRNVDDTRGKAYEAMYAALKTLDVQGQYAVLARARIDFPNAWPMEGDDDELG